MHLRLSPLQIHSLQAWEKGATSPLLTVNTHMLGERAPMAVCQEAESSLLFPQLLLNTRREIHLT